MTRYKEYLRTKGFKLEQDFPYMPFGEVSGNQFLEDIHTEIVDSTIQIKYYYTSIISLYVIDTEGNIIFDQENELF